MNALVWLTEPLSYQFMVRALTTSVVAAVVCALLSCWLVLVGWSLMGDAVSHAVLPGVALAYILDLPFALGAVVFGFLAVILIGVVRGTSRVKEDAAIGIVFTTMFALGLILISTTPSQTDLNHIIFGNVLGITKADMVQVAILAGISLLVLLLKRRDLTLYAFDPVHAHAIGLSPRLLGALLLGMLALTAVVALQIVGVVLVVAMLIIPGATAYLLTDRFSRMLVIAPSLSALCTVVGIYLSYWFDVHPGVVVRVERVADGDPGLLQFLAECGIGVGTRMEPRPGAPYSDSIEVTVADRTIPLGRSATDAVWVSVEG